jgi:C4-dicarboxylate-specific signal transduction histidine kinase
VSPSEPLSLPADAVGPPARELSPADLILANRLVNLEAVLPNITHELNNALQVLSGLSELLASKPGMADDAVLKLQRMYAQSTRCHGLLRDLLAYARRDDVRPEVDVARAIDRALSLRRYHLARARIAVEIETGPSGLVATIDSQYFEQLLVNLVLNAEQAMAGVADPHLSIGCTVAGPDVVLTVKDTGPGIDMSCQEQYFQPFWSSRPGALGLGLPVARALALAAGGDLTFGSASRVDVRLPKG